MHEYNEIEFTNPATFAREEELTSERRSSLVSEYLDCLTSAPEHLQSNEDEIDSDEDAGLQPIETVHVEQQQNQQNRPLPISQLLGRLIRSDVTIVEWRETRNEIIRRGQSAVPDLIAELNSRNFQRRDMAQQLLGELGPVVLTDLRQVLARGCTLEERRRVGMLVDRIQASPIYSLWTVVDKMPAPIRDRLRQMMSSNSLDALVATPETRRVMSEVTLAGRHGAEFLAQSLMTMVLTQGEGSLASPRAQRTLEMLRQLGATAGPALFSIHDTLHESRPFSRLNVLVEGLLANMSRNLSNWPPQELVRDFQGRLRRWGDRTAIDYGQAGLTRACIHDPLGYAWHVSRTNNQVLVSRTHPWNGSVQEYEVSRIAINDSISDDNEIELRLYGWDQDGVTRIAFNAAP